MPPPPARKSPSNSAPPPAARPSLPKPPSRPSPASHPTSSKTFSVKPWTDSGQGKKVVLYAPSGMGKTTLASMAPSPVFIGLDDGGRLIRNPKTGEPVNAVDGIETFADLRAALGHNELFPEGSTIVIDTITKAEALAEPYTFEVFKKEDGSRATSIEDYGWGKGFRFLMETMRLLLTDLDPHVRRGVNVVMLAQQGQATVANLEGTDYLEDGPKLHHAKNGTGVRSEVCEWADHVLRIGHPDISVVKANPKAAKGKVSGTTTRVIYTTKELSFVAKSRPVNGYSLPPVISFSQQDDDALWQGMFHGAKFE